MAKIIQIKEDNIIGNSSDTPIYPVTSTKAVCHNNNTLDSVLNQMIRNDAPKDGYTYGRNNGLWLKIIEGGGGGGTTDYNSLDNKPLINNHILSGNSSLTDLGITPKYISQTKTLKFNN